MFKLYEFPQSGNCYKVRLLFSNLGLPLSQATVDITKGESHKPDFLAKNPAGQVPILELPNGLVLPESNAILWHMAWGTPLLPGDLWLQTQVLRWLSFEQYKLEPKIGVARFLIKTLGKSPEELGTQLKELQKGANFALEVLDKSLCGKDFIVGDTYSIADIGLYGYSHVAEEAHISLDPYENIKRWFANVESQPGYISIDKNGFNHD